MIKFLIRYGIISHTINERCRSLFDGVLLKSQSLRLEDWVMQEYRPPRSSPLEEKVARSVG